MDPEVLQAIMGTPAEGEEEFVATLKSQNLDEDKVNAAVATYRMQKGMKDLVDDETMANVAKAAGYEGTAKAVTPEEGVDPKKPEATSGKVDPRTKQGQGPVKKTLDLSNLDGATRQMVESVFKSNEDMSKRCDGMSEVIKSLTDAAEEKEYVAKAASEFKHVPLEDKELGVMLKSAHDVSPVFAKGFETMLGRVDEMVQKSALLTSMGGALTDDAGGAWSKIEQLADGMVQKSADGLTKEKAIDIVLKSDTGKALYREYLGDHPKQRADIY